MKQRIAIAILVFAVGLGMLLSALHVAPAVDWVWSLGLLAGGVLSLVLGGLTRTTIVVGPFLIVASGMAVLRQLELLRVSVELPVLIMTVGVLVFLSAVLPLPHRPAAEDKPET